MFVRRRNIIASFEKYWHCVCAPVQFYIPTELDRNTVAVTRSRNVFNRKETCDIQNWRWTVYFEMETEFNCRWIIFWVIFGEGGSHSNHNNLIWVTMPRKHTVRINDKRDVVPFPGDVLTASLKIYDYGEKRNRSGCFSWILGEKAYWLPSVSWYACRRSAYYPFQQMRL